MEQGTRNHRNQEPPGTRNQEPPGTRNRPEPGTIDSDGEVVKYQWEISQNNNSFEVFGEGKLLQYTFANAGSAVIQLLIEDNNGLEATTQQTIVLNNIEIVTITPERSNSGSGLLSWLLLLFIPISIFRLLRS